MKKLSVFVLITVLLLQLCCPFASAVGKEYCKYCGRQIDDDSLFCRFCGKKLISDDAPAPTAPQPSSPPPSAAPAQPSTSPLVFTPGQFYNAEDGTVKVYTVQYSAGKIRAGAEKNRDSMLDYSNDAFIYKNGDYYQVMTGKFRSFDEAQYYLSLVRNIKGADDGFLTAIFLPEQAVSEFENVYSKTGFSAKESVGGSARWSAWFPQGFESYDSGDNSWLRYNSDQAMSVYITQEEICATSAKSREKILSDAFSSEKSCHSSISDAYIKDNFFDVTGYDGSYIYYTRGIVTSEVFYTISFNYPIVNRRWCDSNLSSICASFTTF